MLHSLSARLTPRLKALLAHDGLVALGAFFTTLLATPGPGLTRPAIVAATVVALKVGLRTMLPVPGAGLVDGLLSQVNAMLTGHLLTEHGALPLAPVVIVDPLVVAPAAVAAP